MNEFATFLADLYKSPYAGYNYDEGPIYSLEPYFDVTLRIAILWAKE